MQDQTELLRRVRVALQNRDYVEAMNSLKRAADLAQQSGDVGAVGRHLGNLALIYYRLGQPDRALEHFGQALVSARADGDRATEDGLLGNMGNILRELGRHAEAVEHLTLALEIAEEIGDVRGRGIWLGNLGLVYDDLGAPEQAVSMHGQAVEIARQLYDQRNLASRLGNLGNSYIALGDYQGALAVFAEAVTLYRELGDKQGLALRLGVLGNLHAELGRQSPAEADRTAHFKQAVTLYRQTITIARELGDRVAEAELARSTGNLLGNLGAYDDAIRSMQSAYNLFNSLGMTDRLPELVENIDLASRLRDQG